MRAWCRGAALALPLLMGCGVAGAQEAAAGTELTFKVLDLVMKVEDFGGQVADLQVRETATDVRIELAADVLFEFDQATLLPKAEATLTKAAEFIREHAAGVVRIEGHTDAKGDDAYNQRLSERRADAVRQWLARQRLSGVRFASRGFGETQPVAANTRPDGSDDPDGRQKNRRVEIVIRKR
jgi:outer membrane protein OmpA-like peptidoglycan-associated protein